ncbi:MAG: hypothetical protein WA635_03620 [Gallionella sp.]
MRHTLLTFALLQLWLMFSPACQAEGYELGQGLPVGNFLLSGYVNIELVDRFDAPTKLDLDDLSLFASGRINKWVNPFLEAELSKYTLIQQGGGSGGGEFVIERIYNDSIVSEHGTLRVGQMLTPLGYWNLVHAAPLIPIITRPFTTARGFEAYASGVSWLHDPMNNASPNWQLYWQPDTEWFKRPASLAPRSFHNVYGGQINMPLGLLDKIGASFQHGQLIETGETFTLYGINANKTFGKLQLESEAITANFSGTVLPGATPRVHDNESGIFGLADYAITPKWHGILEGEYYQDHTVSESSRNTLVAAAYKPSVPVVWKLEYIHQAGVTASFATISTGWKASFSTLF